MSCEVRLYVVAFQRMEWQAVCMASSSQVAVSARCVGWLGELALSCQAVRAGLGRGVAQVPSRSLGVCAVYGLTNPRSTYFPPHHRTLCTSS